MRLIANKPCSFGGRKFYIGNEIPANLVADVKLQEKMGVITIINHSLGVSGGQSGTLFTQEQVEVMIAEAVEAAEKKRADQPAELQKYVAELKETETGAFESSVPVTVFREKEDMALFLLPEEIQQVFSIMQLNAEEGVRAIADVGSENVLILLHAADSRKTIKNAAKEQADKVFYTEGADT